MNVKTAAALGAIATIGGGIVVLHGITNRRWRDGHTAFTLLAIAAAAISFSQNK